MKRQILIFAVPLAVLLAGTAVYAQEAGTATTTTEGEEITVQDIGLAEEPTVLPGEGLGYFFKNLGRTIKETLTFDPEKKTELQLQHAAQKLAEIKTALEQKQNDPKLGAMIEKNQAKYQRLMEKVSQRVIAMKEKNQELAQKLMDKLADRELKQQEFLQRLEEKAELTEEQKTRIKAAREKALQRFGQVLQKVDERADKIKERLEKKIEEQPANAERRLDHIKVLENLSQKIDNEQAKNALQQTRLKQMQRLGEEMKATVEPEKAEQLKNRLEKAPEVKKEIMKTNPGTLKQLEQRAKQRTERKDKQNPPRKETGSNQ